MRDDGADVHGGEEHRPMTDFGTPGVISAFRGPFHDGPPAEALEVVTPPLEKFGFSEVRRMILTYVVLTLCIMRSLAEWVLRREGRSAAWAAAAGAIDGFILLCPTSVQPGQIKANAPATFPEPRPPAAA